MTMQSSPFFDIKYGWSRGEDGWNVGMDENMVKLSAMLSRDIKGFVTTLPALAPGDIYINTADKQMYYNIAGNTYHITAPLHASYFVNGVQYLWDGATATEVEVITTEEIGVTGAALMRAGSSSEARTTLSLGTAATQDAASFEPTITASPLGGNMFWNGNKAWVDFNAKTYLVPLLGLSTSSSSAITAADTILAAFGKLQAQVTLRATKASPDLTGTPTAPTATVGTNTSQIATTAFVNAAITGSGGAVTSVAGRTGAVVLVKADVGLSNVDNTADTAKPVSTAQQSALSLKADATNAVLFGTPSAETAPVGTNSNQIATTAFVLANAKPFALFHAQEQYPSGTSPGTPVGSVWTNRSLNTVLVNQTAAIFSTTTVNLLPGSYYLEASVPSNGGTIAKCRVRNVTAGTTLLLGTSEKGISTIQVRSTVSGYFTLTVASNVSLQYYVSTAASNGLGAATSTGDVEVYSDLRIWAV